jgi:ABC-type polysaccharide/polyol phosphate export permease
MFKKLILDFKKNEFLFSELVKRDFKKKYKRTYLGMLWSVLSPLLTLLVMSLVFTNFFGRTTPHYTIYLFCGNIVFSFFSDATNGGMGSLISNSAIFTKINVPKYLFLFSRNVSSLINFGLTLLVFFVFCIFDQITFRFSFLLLIVPIVCLVVFNIGIGLILSALFVFFRDMQYLWSVFTTLLMYASAIFYTIDGFSPVMQRVFLCNPIYVYIKYFRIIVIDNAIPSLEYNLLAVGYALLALMIGVLFYKKLNDKFLYYV